MNTLLYVLCIATIIAPPVAVFFLPKRWRFSGAYLLLIGLALCIDIVMLMEPPTFTPSGELVPDSRFGPVVFPTILFGFIWVQLLVEIRKLFLGPSAGTHRE